MMNWLDIVIIVCIAIGLIKGLFDGIIKQVVSLLALIIAILFAGVFAKPVRDFLSDQPAVAGSMPEFIITGICYLLAFALIVLIIYGIGKLVNIAIKVTPAKTLNHILGGFFGALMWILALSLTFNLLTVFDPNYKLITKQARKESVLFSKVNGVVPTLYPYIKNYLNGRQSK
ncbi:MAG: CvpA family protein [Dysgonamonadaceae bacterium]|jgi:membrane protein required for colicin V production|nr:CvpA family protein [Dysgonamonadaceae bacterium]